MPETGVLDFSLAKAYNSPFPHFSSTSVFTNGFEKQIYNWLKTTLQWELVETDFYEQYEFSLLNIDLPKDMSCLIESQFINSIGCKFSEIFQVPHFKLVDVVAHKLVNSQHIGVHNDYINGEETHRLILNLNPDWKQENGGYLLLFNSSDANDMSKVVSPVNNSAFGFEISKHSHHAVSRIYHFIRYSIVYTYKIADVEHQ